VPVSLHFLLPSAVFVRAEDLPLPQAAAADPTSASTTPCNGLLVPLPHPLSFADIVPVIWMSEVGPPYALDAYGLRRGAEGERSSLKLSSMTCTDWKRIDALCCDDCWNLVDESFYQYQIIETLERLEAAADPLNPDRTGREMGTWTLRDAMNEAKAQGYVPGDDAVIGDSLRAINWQPRGVKY
jgi:hypothetical protein